LDAAKAPKIAAKSPFSVGPRLAKWLPTGGKTAMSNVSKGRESESGEQGRRKAPRRTRGKKKPMGTSPRGSDQPFTLGERERNYVFAVAMKYVKDEEAANDVAQEALLLAHRHRESFRGDSRFSTWLYRIAATTSLMHLRKQRRHSREILMAQRVSDDEGDLRDLAQAPGPGPEEHSAARQDIEVAKAKLAGLGEKYRDIFWMRFFEGYTETEIASRLNLNVTTVKTRAYRARLALREAITAERQHAA
jgi:RNA polymerase sigma-70 factor, ECF subfamily